MAELRPKLRALGLTSKVDLAACEEDADYFNRWSIQLNHLFEHADAIGEAIRRAPVRSLDDVPDARSYFNENRAWREFVRDLDEDTDVRSAYLDAFLARQQRQRQLQTPAPCDAAATAAAAAAEAPVSGIMHLSDTDWEDTIDGARIFLYGRDARDRDRTTLLVVPLEDYFYIEIGGKPGASYKEVTNAVGRKAWGMEKMFKADFERQVEAGNGAGGDARSRETRQGGVFLVGATKPLVAGTELVTDHRSVYGFQRTCGTFLKIRTLSPTVTRVLFRMLSKQYPNWNYFEATTDPVNKYLTKHGIFGCAAVEYRGTLSAKNNLSTCTDLVTNCLHVGPSTDDTVPFYVPRNMYFDIECKANDVNVFPTADECPVIQISYVVADGPDVEIEKGVLCLWDTPGEHFTSFASEDQLLIRFAQLLRHYKPENLVGYNSNNFDLPYILDRMDVLGIPFAKEFSRRRNVLVAYKRSHTQTNQAGAVAVTRYVTPGLTMLDQLAILKTDVTLRLRSYALKSVCEYYLKDGDNKEDIRYADIPVLFESTAGRIKLASYCLKDTALLVRLDKVASIAVKVEGMAKVLGTTMKVILTRGLVFWLMGKAKQYTERYNFLIPSLTDAQKPSFDKYEGAFVVDPIVGLHMDPVVVCDAASLYPSCMRCDNLSWDSICLDEEERLKHPDDFVKKHDDWFVRKDLHEGILVKLQTDLAVERKAAKKKRDEFEEGSDGYKVYESVQLGTKVAMNSLYGALGSSTSPIPMVQIAKTITGRGRFMLNMFKDFVEERYQALTGEKEPVVIVYGDTDSIFVKMPGVALEKAIGYGHVLEKAFRVERLVGMEPHNFEYEKTFYPFMISSKKRYIGALYENDPNKAKLKAMGLQLVRRDSPVLCHKVMQGFFDKFLLGKDIEGAVQHVKTTIEEMFAGRLPLKDFEITKKISKLHYDVEPEHVKAWRRMSQRVGQANAPAVGERFEYVVVWKKDYSGKRITANGSERIMDMVMAQEQGTPDLHYTYYFKRFIVSPLKSFMTYSIGEERTAAILDDGMYTQRRTVRATKGSILAFCGVKTHTTKKTRVPIKRKEETSSSSSSGSSAPAKKPRTGIANIFAKE